MGKILTKDESFRLYQLGAFGNRVKQWDSLPAVWRDDTYHGKIVIRSRKGGGGPCRYDIDPTWNAVNDELQKPKWAGHHRYVFFNQAIPVDRIVLNAEVADLPQPPGLVMAYSTLATHMRTALKQACRVAQGWEVIRIIRSVCDPVAADCLEALLAEYPSHAVEFTVLDRSIGDLGWNTIVWEVRAY